ncbi:hypothetical protein K474DRAFT_1712944 [Panus rudis PR-1116 ss-1]|nr:hypothetical protein K474DRAFT_1712944 [Panus rudis PR-1116 ss-1]
MAPFYNDDSDDEYEPSQVPLHYHIAASGLNISELQLDLADEAQDSKIKIERNSKTKLYSPAMEPMNSQESGAGNHRRRSARLEVDTRGTNLTKDLFGPGGALDSQTSNTQYVGSLLSKDVQDSESEEMEQRKLPKPLNGSTADHSLRRDRIYEHKLARAAKIHRRLAEVHTTMTLLHNELADVLDDASVEEGLITSESSLHTQEAVNVKVQAQMKKPHLSPLESESAAEEGRSRHADGSSDEGVQPKAVGLPQFNGDHHGVKYVSSGSLGDLDKTSEDTDSVV